MAIIVFRYDEVFNVWRFDLGEAGGKSLVVSDDSIAVGKNIHGWPRPYSIISIKSPTWQFRNRHKVSRTLKSTRVAVSL